MTDPDVSGNNTAVPVPLRISYELWGTKFCRLHLIRVDQEPDSLRRYWPSGLTEDAVDFITEHCKCAYCKAVIALPLGPCPCGKAEKRGYVLEAIYPQETHRELFKRVLERESSRAKNRARRARVAANGGKADPKLFPEMLEAQEHRCYYCAASLIDEHGKAAFHVDHYEPLHRGGSNDLENIVLACASCNKRKGKLWPTTFKLKIARERGPEGTIVVRRIWRQLDRWRTSKRAGT